MLRNKLKSNLFPEFSISETALFFQSRQALPICPSLQNYMKMFMSAEHS